MENSSRSPNPYRLISRGTATPRLSSSRHTPGGDGVVGREHCRHRLELREQRGDGELSILDVAHVPGFGNRISGNPRSRITRAYPS